MFDRTSIIVACSTMIFSTILFFLQNGELIGSLAAAALATALVWCSYVIIAWIFQAIASKD
jgi:hypothetical protein